MFSWAINDRGQGLLRLEPGWRQDRGVYEKAEMEISQAGYVIEPADTFWLRMDGDTYFTLREA